jgi:hypothetical protein
LVSTPTSAAAAAMGKRSKEIRAAEKKRPAAQKGGASSRGRCSPHRAALFICMENHD